MQTFFWQGKETTSDLTPELNCKAHLNITENALYKYHYHYHYSNRVQTHGQIESIC